MQVALIESGVIFMEIITRNLKEDMYEENE